MGWTLRKSFKMGPARLNLSSRGIGYSVGVRGLRTGTSSRGRNYVTAGMGPMRYYSSASAHRTGRLTPTTAPNIGGITAFGCLLIASMVLGVLALVPETRWYAIGAWLVIVAALLIFALTRSGRARKLAELEAAVAAFLADPSPTEVGAQHISEMREALGTVPQEAQARLEAAYGTAVAEAVADQCITPEEQRRLRLIARACGLTDDAVHRANLGGFTSGLAALVKDARLTAEEDEQLAALRAAFGIADAEVAPLMATVEQLRRARVIEDEEPQSIDAGISLKKGEACYHTAPFTELREYVGEGFRAIKSGTLYVTNERLLLVAGGVTTLKLGKILGAQLAQKSGGGQALTLTIDGRKTPLYLDLAEPLIMLAYAKRALANRSA
jgi:hypothetical protein